VKWRTGSDNRKQRSKRSIKENSYYWGVVVEILRDYFGYETYEAEEVHDGLKLKFLRIHEGEALETVRSTTKLSTVEFEDYLEKIRRWASKEHNCYIPLPNECDFYSSGLGQTTEAMG
jgi:hypothetical protein